MHLPLSDAEKMTRRTSDDNKAAGGNSRNTWEKLRFGRAARQRNSRCSWAILLKSLFFFIFFFCQQITGIQSFHLWQIFIRDARILRLASHARCNCFRFETFELYLTSLMLAQSEFPTRKLYSALVLTRERMSRLILDRTKKSGEITFGDE